MSALLNLAWSNSGNVVERLGWVLQPSLWQFALVLARIRRIVGLPSESASGPSWSALSLVVSGIVAVCVMSVLSCRSLAESPGDPSRSPFVIELPGGTKVERAEVATSSDKAKPAAANQPALCITGRILDAETGQPIEKCRMVPTPVYRDDATDITWQTQYMKEFTDGRYLYETDRPWSKTRLRVEADGYRPATTRVEIPAGKTATLELGSPGRTIDGKLIEQPAIEFDDVVFMLHEACVATLEPGKSQHFLIRPVGWIAALQPQIQPGRYRAAVRYRWLSTPNAARTIRKSSPLLEAAAVDVVSAAVAIEIDGETRKADLTWGEAVNGLRAAVSFEPSKATHMHADKLDVRLHLQNVGTMPLKLISDLSLPHASVTIKNDQGESVELDDSLVGGRLTTGMRALVTLTPQQVLILNVGQLGLAITEERAKQFDTMTLRKLIAPAGNYSMQLETSFRKSVFNARWVEGQENIFVKDAWVGKLKTGVTPFEISSETIKCRIIDAVTGRPVAGTTINFRFIKPKSGDTAEEIVEDVFWGPQAPSSLHFFIPDKVLGRADRDEIAVQWGVGGHADYEPYSSTERIPLKPFFHKGPQAARETLATIKLTPKTPKGSEIEVLTGMKPDAFTLIQLWSIRIIMPALERDGTVGFSIRYTKLDEERIDPKQVAWGKPDPDGLSLGLFLLPHKDKYQIGDRVQMRLFVRNDGKQAIKEMTFWNITWPETKDFTVTDQTGAMIEVRNSEIEEWSGPGWIAGAMSGALDPGNVHAFRIPFELAIGGDGTDKLVGRVIDARPGQTLQLRLRAHNGSNRIRAENEAPPETGNVMFTVAAAGDDAGEQAEDKPTANRAGNSATDTLAENGPSKLLGRMIEQPSLELLRQLLASAGIEYPQPIELLDSARNVPGNKGGSKIRVIATGVERFAVVEARVRPVTEDAAADPNDRQRLPECAFVFDMQGQLIAAIGGKIGTTIPRSPSPERVDVLTLGPEEDWFVRVARFEDSKPFNYQSVYYRIANPIVRSLKFFHYANSLAWSIGPQKIARHGTLYFDLPKVSEKLDDYATGSTPDGVAVSATVHWDGDRNRFVGVTTQQVADKPLYEIDTEWSRDFQPFAPKPDQLVVSGGAREYNHWHGWDAVVPRNSEVLIRLSIPQLEGPPKRVERKLGPGRHIIQIQAEPHDDAPTASLKLWIDKDDKQDLELPHQLGDRPATHPPIVQVLNPGESRQLLNRPLKTSPQPFVAEIKFRQMGTGDNGQLEELIPSTAPVPRPFAPPTQPFDPTTLKFPPGAPDSFAPNTVPNAESGYPVIKQFVTEEELDGWIPCEFGLQYRVRAEAASLVLGELPLLFVDIRNRGTFKDMGLELHQSQHFVVVDGNRYERRDQPWGGVAPLEPEGKPVAGMTVVAGAIINDSSKRGGAKTVTDAAGRYRLKMPSPGIYSVYVRHLKTEPQEVARMTAIADNGVLVEAGKISASRMVWMDGIQVDGTLVDEQGQPVPDTTVYCYSAAKPQTTAEVVTVKSDDQGRFEFWLPPGRAHLYSSKRLSESADNPDGSESPRGCHDRRAAQRRGFRSSTAAKAGVGDFEAETIGRPRVDSIHDTWHAGRATGRCERRERHGGRCRWQTDRRREGVPLRRPDRRRQ